MIRPPEVSLVVDASVGLKWALDEPDSLWAEALVHGDEELLVPDFWLHEAANVCWLQVHKRVWTPEEAREGLALLRAQVPPTPTTRVDHMIARGLAEKRTSGIGLSPAGRGILERLAVAARVVAAREKREA